MDLAEFLKSQGASEEDVKTLTSGVARKAFDKLQDDLAAEAKKAAEADAARIDYKEKADDWWNNKAIPEYQKMEREKAEALAERARAIALIKQSQDEGLRKIAEDWEKGNPPNGNPNPNPNPALPAGFDPSKFVTQDMVLQLAEREGDAIAIASDIAFEHRQLFPDKPLNFREMRKAAVAAKKPVEQYWMETFGVQAARDQAAAARQKAHDDALIEQGKTAERERLTSMYGNPETRPLSTSTSPFAVRKETGRDKQPWEVGGENLERERVQRATKHVVELASKTA